MLLGLAGASVVTLVITYAAVALDPHQAFDAQRRIHLTPGVVIGQLLSYLPFAAVLLPLLPFVAMRTLRELGLHGVRWRDLAFGLLGALFMFAVVDIASVIQNFFFHVNGEAKDIALFGTTHNSTLIMAFSLIAIFCAPFVEELVFRGFIFNALLRYLPFTVAIALDGIIFGAVHLDPIAFFPLACGGVILAFIYYRTGSLIAAMVSHGMFNFTNVVLVLASGHLAK